MVHQNDSPRLIHVSRDADNDANTKAVILLMAKCGNISALARLFREAVDQGEGKRVEQALLSTLERLGRGGRGCTLLNDGSVCENWVHGDAFVKFLGKRGLPKRAVIRAVEILSRSEDGLECLADLLREKAVPAPTRWIIAEALIEPKCRRRYDKACQDGERLDGTIKPPKQERGAGNGSRTKPPRGRVPA